MKRVEKKIRFRKEGGGSFRMANGKIIKPGQIFSAYPNEIPKEFLDVIVPLDKIPEVPTPEEVPVKVTQPEYSLTHRGGGYYDIVDTNGKQMNEVAIKGKEAAEKEIGILLGAEE
jgi:hypothetical protein